MIRKNTFLFFLIIFVFTINPYKLYSQDADSIFLSEALTYLSEKHRVFFTYNPMVIKKQKVKLTDFENLSIYESIDYLKQTTPFKIEYLGNNYYVIYNHC